MKKLLTTTIIIAACAALCAAVWPQSEADGKVPAEAVKSVTSAECAEFDERSSTHPRTALTTTEAIILPASELTSENTPNMVAAHRVICHVKA